MAAADQVLHDQQRQHDEDKARGEGGDGLGAGGALGALDDDAAAVRKDHVIGGLGAVEVEDDVQAAAVHAHDEAGDELLEDLAEGQGHDGQVVAVEAQHRDAHQKAHHGGEEGADNHGEGQAQGGGGDGGGKTHGGDDAGEGAHAHEARVAQGQIAQDAHHQVQGDGHDDIAADGHQHALLGAGEGPVFAENGDQKKGGADDDVIDQIAARASGNSFVLHGVHLRPFPACACRAGLPGAPAG